MQSKVSVSLAGANGYLGNVVSFLSVNGHLKGLLHRFSSAIIVQNFCIRVSSSGQE